MIKTRASRRAKIKSRIRRKVLGTADIPRLCVYRSNKAIYVQIIDDSKGHTVASASSFELGTTNNPNVEVSKNVGMKIAEKAKASGVEAIVFDRGGYQYHGKVKALAEGAREAGLAF